MDSAESDPRRSGPVTNEPNVSKAMPAEPGTLKRPAESTPFGCHFVRSVSTEAAISGGRSSSTKPASMPA